ncbi:MAG: hypothetical protein GY809_18065, partial [Planctomycetes bacterium]|nr:hypothetical protein [Planctomycetota bacterium]
MKHQHVKHMFMVTLFSLVVFAATFAHAADTARPASRYAKASKLLLDNRVTEVVFAERYYGNDGHWYANFGYFFDGPDNV